MNTPPDSDLPFRPEHLRQPLLTWVKILCIVWPLAAVLFNLLPWVQRKIAVKILGGKRNVILRRMRLDVFSPGAELFGLSANDLAPPENQVLACIAERIVLRLSLKSMWKGLFSCKLNVYGLDCSLTRKKEPYLNERISNIYSGRSKTTLPWVVTKLFIHDARISYTDATNEPLTISATRVNIRATNLSALPSIEALPAKISLLANVCNGTLKAKANANLFEGIPDFDAEISLTDARLVCLNEFIKAFAHFEVGGGSLSCFCEVAGKDGAIKGYVKPVISRIEFGNPGKKRKLKQRLFEGLLDVAAYMVTNKNTQEIATKISFEGKEKFKIRFRKAVTEMVAHAMGWKKPAAPEDEISLASVS